MIDGASALEISWTGIAILGFLFSSWGTWDSWLDFMAILGAIRVRKAVMYGPRWWIAMGFLGSDALFGLTWAGFILIGILAMTVPPAPNPQREWVSEVTGWVLVALELMLACIEIWWRLVRIKIRELIPGVALTLEQLDARHQANIREQE